MSNRKRERAGQEMVGGYFPVAEIEAIDAYAAKVEANQPGLKVSRTSAMRMLIAAGLKAMASEVAS